MLIVVDLLNFIELLVVQFTESFRLVTTSFRNSSGDFLGGIDWSVSGDAPYGVKR